MKKAGIAVGAAVVLGIIAYAAMSYINSSSIPSSQPTAQVQDANTPNSVPIVEIRTPVPEKPNLTKEEALLGMSKEELIKKFYTYDEAYYTKVDPNRIQQTRPLEPGEKRPNIKIVKGGFQFAVKGKEAPEPIEVMAVPNMPCTFYAQDLGRFTENGKGCVTVKADEKGTARVHYVSDNLGGSMIIAHSPEVSGWARIQIHVVTEKDYASIMEKSAGKKGP